MTTTVKALYRGTLGTSSTPLYTTPLTTSAVLTSLVAANKTAVASTVTVLIDGVYVLSATPIDGNQVLTMDVRQVLATGKVIAGLAGTASTVDLHLSGVEIT